jgi:2-polyprenyl-3-methyl-5-hydroxy-6-metoxy-1,4-benzoquinol methylase
MDFTGERVVPGKMENYIGTYIEHLTRYVFCLGFCINKKVMDVACGTGYGLEMISSVAQCGLGVDIDQKSLDFAQKNYKFYGKNFGFVKRNLEKETLNSGFFEKVMDTIISFETIEHLENPDFFIQNVKDILKDNGHFIFSIPCKSDTPYHKKLYTFETAKALMDKHFSNIQWFDQVGAHITAHSEKGQFFIGVAQK